MKRRFLILAAIAAVAAMGGLFTSTASADKPSDVVFQFPPTGPDGLPLAFDSPCTGEPVSVSGLFTVTAKIHMHGDQLVGNGKQTAVSDQGHVLKGVTHVSQNKNGVRQGFSDNWEHPETGERFRVHGVRFVNLMGDEPVMRVDKFDVTCQGKSS